MGFKTFTLREINISPIWENEPDELRFTDEGTGLECFIRRNYVSGFLCGYVIIPKGHRLYGHNLVHSEDINIHGDITFSQYMKYIEEYCVGFDCMHAEDTNPFELYLNDLKSDGFETYKDIEFVKNECKKLAKQLN